MEDCIFCKIVKGEIPSEKIFENEEILAFKDIHPIAPVHVLIIPKIHFKNLMEVNEGNEKYINAIFRAIPEIAKKLGVSENGFRIVSNCGKDAGQEVMHLHFHLIAGKKMV